MIDTLKLSTKLYRKVSKLLKTKKWWLHEKYDFKRRMSRIFLYRKESGYRITYYPQAHKVFVEFSVPKLLFKNNVAMYTDTDFPILRKKFNSDMKIILGDVVPDFIHWQISRIDACYNFAVNDINDKQKYIDLARLSSCARYKKIQYDTSVFFHNKSCSFKIYDKAAEMAAHDDNPSVDAEKVLRFEVTLRRRAIRSFFKLPCSDLTVKNLLHSAYLKLILEKFLGKLQLVGKLLSKKELHSFIKQNSTVLMGKRLCEFIDLFSTYGHEKTKQQIAGRTFESRISAIKNLGLKSFLYCDEIENPISFDIDVSGLCFDTNAESKNLSESCDCFDILNNIRLLPATFCEITRNGHTKRSISNKNSHKKSTLNHRALIPSIAASQSDIVRSLI